MRKLILFSFLLNLLISNSIALDSFKQAQYMTDGQNLTSANGTFQLGFFTPGALTDRFLGIWFCASPQTVVWIANHDQPLNDTSGVLSISGNGNLVLADTYTGNTVWLSNSTNTTNPTSVRLLESGNLVLRDLITDSILWQSFDWPTNTILPGMKIGKDIKTGHKWSLISWHTSENPADGKYSYRMDTQGSPQLVMWAGTTKWYRTGPWIGTRFSGIPEMTTYQDMFSFNFTNGPDEISFGFSSKPGSLLSRVALNESGVVQRLVWDQNISSWSVFWSGPRDQCDYYSKCGVFGLCNANDATICSCLQGFEPKSLIDWYLRDNSQGCMRRVKLDCGNKDYGFYVVKWVKLPDTQSAIVDATISLDQCREKCMKNCSCVAYSSADTRNGGRGCIMWVDDLVDTRFIDGGQDLYIKIAQSELEISMSGKSHLAILITTSTILFVICLISLSFIVWRRKRRGDRKVISRTDNSFDESASLNSTELPLFDMNTVMSATNNFCFRNKIGEGSFGPVYKGQLQNGQEIAVKRLAKESPQGIHEFMNEVSLMAKLQHRNLVRLLGCCIHNNERMLVYEYMSNKSLDFFIFDENRRSSMNWAMRLDIILGIARGILYLHQDSRFNIIHRDLKAANILLDDKMVPKISDFGTARLFTGDQVEIATRTIVGTHGYLSPEYAMDGKLSVKSDVYSFGVLLLEILSGRRNQGKVNLLAYTWSLWEQCELRKLLDPIVTGPRPMIDLLRCIQVGLLCVQECPEDRPPMSSVLLMLSSEIPALLQPKKPVICSRMWPIQASILATRSVNWINLTILEGR